MIAIGSLFLVFVGVTIFLIWYVTFAIMVRSGYTTTRASRVAESCSYVTITDGSNERNSRFPARRERRPTASARCRWRDRLTSSERQTECSTGSATPRSTNLLLVIIKKKEEILSSHAATFMRFFLYITHRRSCYFLQIRENQWKNNNLFNKVCTVSLNRSREAFVNFS